MILAQLELTIGMVAAVVGGLVTAITFLTRTLIGVYKTQRDDYREWSVLQAKLTERVVTGLIASGDAMGQAASELARLAQVVGRCPHVKDDDE